MISPLCAQDIRGAGVVSRGTRSPSCPRSNPGGCPVFRDPVDRSGCHSRAWGLRPGGAAELRVPPHHLPDGPCPQDQLVARRDAARCPARVPGRGAGLAGGLGPRSPCRPESATATARRHGRRSASTSPKRGRCSPSISAGRTPRGADDDVADRDRRLIDDRVVAREHRPAGLTSPSTVAQTPLTGHRWRRRVAVPIT